MLRGTGHPLIADVIRLPHLVGPGSMQVMDGVAFAELPRTLQ